MVVSHTLRISSSFRLHASLRAHLLKQLRMGTTRNDDHVGFPPLLGGDYCGLSATFDLQGKLVPIPERLIPERLLAWGQVPTALEVFVTESVMDVRLREWCRQTRTILPEIGCGVDHLQTMDQEIEVESFRLWQDDAIYQILYPSNSDDSWRLETIFGWKAPGHRVRISVELNEEKLELESLVLIHIERQISMSDDSIIPSELDAGTVHEHMGALLLDSYSFATSEMTTAMDRKHVYFPPNLTLCYTTTKDNALVIEFGQICPHLQIHQIVRRTFFSINDCSIETRTEPLDFPKEQA